MDHNRTPISAHTYIHIKALLIESGGGPPSLVHSWPIYPTPTRRISLGVSSTKPSSSSSSRQTLFSIRARQSCIRVTSLEQLSVPEFSAQWLFGLKKHSFHYWSAPRGPRGVKKSHFFFYKWKCFPFALRLPSNCTNCKKLSKLKKNHQKNPVFIDIFEYSSTWGQY